MLHSFPTDRPALGRLPTQTGLGFKSQHFSTIYEQTPTLGFFELHAENYLVEGGIRRRQLDWLAERYPLSFHGVGSSVGGEQPLDKVHLSRLKQLVDTYQPAMFSEHLAWSTHGGVFYNDLLPVPLTRSSLKRVCEHIDQLQQTLGRTVLIENPSTYVRFKQDAMTIGEFMWQMVETSQCGLLMDVNNHWVTCQNHGWDAKGTLSQFPLHAIEEIHLAGFATDTDALGNPVLIDDHGSPVADPVWELYADLIQQIGPAPTLIERDNNLPEFDELLAETQLADRIMAKHPQRLTA